jgi:hypothetical protein
MAVEDSFILFVLEHGLKVCSLLEIRFKVTSTRTWEDMCQFISHHMQ